MRRYIISQQVVKSHERGIWKQLVVERKYTEFSDGKRRGMVRLIDLLSILKKSGKYTVSRKLWCGYLWVCDPRGVPVHMLWLIWWF